MSYILDALRKSESERQQGRVPDLGQQVQMIHRPRKAGIPVSVWVAIGLVMNAAVLALVFWPQTGLRQASQADAVAASAETAAVPADAVRVQPQAGAAGTDRPDAAETPANVAVPPGASPVAPATADNQNPWATSEEPTIITPSVIPVSPLDAADEAEASPYQGRVPHLVEMPMSLQRRIPDLVFNSHVYASEPSRRRVMINNRTLRTGDSFSGIRVERITEDGVELSMDSQRFRVGVVRDWISPD